MTNLITPHSLDSIDRKFLTTAEAAYFLNRKPQTLRNWAQMNSGPVKCVRIAGRLAWPTAAIKAMLASAEAEYAVVSGVLGSSVGQ